MITKRLATRVRRDFAPSEADTALELLAELGLDPDSQDDPYGTERVLAAVVLFAQGNSQRLLSAAALARRDWRDVLIAVGLEHDDWRIRLTEALGSE